MLFKTNEEKTFEMLNYVMERVVKQHNEDLQEDMVVGVTTDYECYPNNGLIGVGLFVSEEEKKSYIKELDYIYGGVFDTSEYINIETIDLFFILHEIGHIATNHYHSEYIHAIYTQEFTKDMSLKQYMLTPKEHEANMWALKEIVRMGVDVCYVVGYELYCLIEEVQESLEVVG